jgi:hypothetical protein
VKRLFVQPLKERVFNDVYLERNHRFYLIMWPNYLPGLRNIRTGRTSNGIVFFGVTKPGHNLVNILRSGLLGGPMKSITKIV